MGSILDILKLRPLLLDGAMGTELIDRVGLTNEFSDRCNVSHPQSVRAIHRDYTDAGCDCVTTNTFGGSHIREGLALANEVASQRCLALGSMGPVGNFETKLEIFASVGCAAIIFETFSEVEMMVQAIRAAKAVAKWPVIASFSFRPTHSIPDFIRSAIDAGADVVGTNCVHPDIAAQFAETIVRAANGVPTIIQPNAGSPHAVRGQFVYDIGPEAMAAFASRALQIGVRMIGGCCGTKPAHIEAMRAAMNGLGYCPIGSR